MTFCSTTGFILAPYFPCYGKLTDNQIFSKIFDNQIPIMAPFIEMLKTHSSTTLVLDRGFQGWKNQFEAKQKNDPSFFPNLKIVLPVNKCDSETGQYSKIDVDESRLKVTSLRGIVERVHSQIKTFKFFYQENNSNFLRNNLGFLLNFIISSLNKFGYARRTGKDTETFSAEESVNTLKGFHPRKFYSELNSFLVSQTHDLSYRKRSNWIEHSFLKIPEYFPFLNETEIESMSGGPYGLKKAKQYRKKILQLLQERADLIGPDSRSNTSYATIGAVKTYRTLLLNEKMASEYLNADFVLRLDVPSFFGSTRKYIVAIAGRKTENGIIFDTGCTCSTGSRSTPCVHGTLAFYLFCNFLQNNEEFPVE